MDDLRFTIESIKNARDIYRLNATSHTNKTIRDFADVTSDLMTEWILQLEHTENMLKLNHEFWKNLKLIENLEDALTNATQDTKNT